MHDQAKLSTVKLESWSKDEDAFNTSGLSIGEERVVPPAIEATMLPCRTCTVALTEELDPVGLLTVAMMVYVFSG
jgi:hypothetical protein